ncbi:hypothetical protein GCM10023235_11000 [Kitasatospora terrestris]|uniref:Uncharacterized protein n=1 Tax=Kitasatospora terrestris TaxID=258051 RepID=A0ABP9DGS4_9ACTN
MSDTPGNGEPIRPSWPTLSGLPLGPGWEPDLWPEPATDRLELLAGPLDGLHLDVTPFTPTELARGIALEAGDGCAYPGGFSVYRRHPEDPDRMRWERDTPP